MLTHLKSTHLALLFWCISLHLHAQTPIDWWYFGDSTGVHFTGSGPVAVSDGQLFTWEGCASISNPGGDLLFYTNGETVWDSTHNIMPNGSGLFGSISTTQSATIVPSPAFDGKYFVFTAPSVGGAMNCGTGQDCYFAYSVVDMSLNAGLGDVVAGMKNVVLFDSASEKCAVTSHANGVDYWVIAHDRYENGFHSFHVSDSGIVDTMTSYAGSDYSATGAAVGEMTFSPSGDQLAVTVLGLSIVELYFFDVFTGQVQLQEVISTGSSPPYGLAFSPSGQFLYISSPTGGISLKQYNLSAGNIQASEEALVSNADLGDLRIGPDGIIYLAKDHVTPFLARIVNPDLSGFACGFQDSAVALTAASWSGLPSHIDVRLLVPKVFSVVRVCHYEATSFSYDSAGVDSLHWNFGDPSSGASNTSEAFSPTHVYTGPGLYDVTLIVHRPLGTDTIIQAVQIFPRQSVDLGNDTTLCEGDTLTLSAAQPHAFFEWRNGHVGDEALVTGDSLIWVTAFGVCDTVSDTLLAVFDESLTITLDATQTPCDTVDFLLKATVTGDRPVYQWSTGGSDSTLIVSEAGTYGLTVSNACGSVSAQTEVQFVSPLSLPLLPPDTVLCSLSSFVVDHQDQPHVDYLWSDSTDQQSILLDSTQLIWLMASNACGAISDSMHLTFVAPITAELGPDTNICEGDSIPLVATHPGATYAWNTGESSDTIWSDQVETFNYVVTITDNDCQAIESKRVDMDDFYCPSIDCSVQYPNTFSPNGDGTNDLFRAWSDCDIYSYSLHVYNRWGQLVHHDDHVLFGWDGVSQGRPVPEGVYYFVIDIEDRVVVDEDRNVYRGSFTLIR